jgi:hypothetical protein
VLITHTESSVRTSDAHAAVCTSAATGCGAAARAGTVLVASHSRKRGQGTSCLMEFLDVVNSWV